MLAGFAALAVPIVLHLIARQRFPIQPIPNIRLLQVERRTNAYAVRPVDLLQLLLRLLVVGLVVLAMTRPTVLNALVGRSARNIVVFLECSPSMLASAENAGADGKGGATSFARAREKAAELLKSAGPHDHVAYIEAGSAARIVSPLTGEAAGVVQAAAGATVQYGAGSSVGPALAMACTMLTPRKEALSEVYVLSDMRRNVLDGWDQKSRGAYAAARERMGGRLSVRFVDFSPKKLSNVGIADVKLAPERISTGSDAHLIATVRNLSDEEKEVAVALSVRQTAKTRRTVKVPPQSEAIVDLATSFDSTVNTYCRLDLSPPDALGVDDSFFVPVRLDSRFEVLIIDGSEPKPAAATGGAPDVAAPQAGISVSGAKMLEFALNPAQFAAAEGRGRSRNSFVKRVTLTSVNTAMMGTSQLIVLYNVGRLPQRTHDDLRDFIKSGRSVMLIPGDEVNLIDFRTSFVNPPEGSVALSPAAVDNAVPVEPGTRVSLGGTVHPVMEPFRDLRKGDLGAIQFKRLRRLQPVAGANVIFSVGDLPAAVEMQAVVPGDKPEQRKWRGRICVLGFGLEPAWSNLALTRVFVPLMWRLTDHSAGRLGALPVDVARSGERAVLDCSDFAPLPCVAILGPDEKPLRHDDGWPMEIPLSEADSAVITDLTKLGAYKVTGQGQISVEVRLADGKTVSGAAYTTAVRAALQGKADSLIIAAGKINRADAAGASFRDAVSVKGIRLALADGSSITCDVAGGALDDALGGRVNEITVAAGGGTRKIPASDVKDKRYAEAIEFGGPGAAARKVRYVGVNAPAGESETAALSNETIKASLGDAGWQIVRANELKLTDLTAGELWYLAAIVLMLIYFAEGSLGHWLSWRRERTRVG